MFLAISSSAQSMGMVIDSPAADIAQGVTVPGMAAEA